MDLHLVDASDLFLGKLAGVTDPEQKRKIIGNTFIEVFDQVCLTHTHTHTYIFTHTHVPTHGPARTRTHARTHALRLDVRV